MNRKQAIAAIDRAGMLLVFPLDNRKEPASIWSAFYPKEEMRWEWDEDGDNRVGELWHLRSELSTTGKVIYTKWYQGRATYFSRPVFVAMLRALNPSGEDAGKSGLGETARRILRTLEGESPLSTKELKRQADLGGRANEAVYERAMKELWSRLLIVAYGEVDDGAFPSLAVGATRSLFEESWTEAFALDGDAALARVRAKLGEKSLFFKHFQKLSGKPAAGKRAPVSARAAGKVPDRRVIRYEDL